MLPQLPRAPNDEELLILLQNRHDDGVHSVLTQQFTDTRRAPALLETTLRVRDRLLADDLADLLTPAAKPLLNSATGDLGLRLAGAFKLRALDADIAVLLESANGNPARLAAVMRTLRELESEQVEAIARLAADTRAPREVQIEAFAALAASRNERGPTMLLELWPKLPAATRPAAADRLASSKRGATALVAALRSGAVARADLTVGAVEKLRVLLPADPYAAALWKEFGGDMKRALRLKGGKDDFAETKLTLAGPFTVECWLKLEPKISNQDGILGAPGQLDMNFFNSQFRVWVGGGQHDIVVAKKKTTAGAWTHYAVTRDAPGVFRIFINGELDSTSAARSTNTFTGLDIGRTIPAAGGTDGWLTEYRVWNVARTPQQIRDCFDRSYANAEFGIRNAESADRRPRLRRNETGDTAPVVPAASAPIATDRPPGLAHVFSGAYWGKLNGQARVELAADAPTLLTEAEGKAQAEKFARFRMLAEKPGNAAHGKELFTAVCLVCHNVRGEGGQVAPALDGVGLTGVEALLRNILTPNAAMEGGYRKFRIETKDDELVEGLLVAEDANAIVVRQPNAADQRVPRANVKQAGFLNLSIMPEGLLEGMKPEEVASLFAHLKTLK